ncbi:(deoxy)nucleoside triphosphate pyrophosphohydrolase [Alphaproteobacteria bacterium]|nr:(deoxy)nucleoside triphosphate pyrophosphohydrolase [Alphaproteobacteria bacterium]
MQITEVKNQLVSTIALIDDENKILIGKRPMGKIFENLWEFPGGKVKKNETAEDALIREAKEEINVDLSMNCIAPFAFSTYKSKNINVIILLFLSRKWNLEPICKSHTELKWVKANNLNKYIMPPANKCLISSLQDLFL